MAKQKKKYAEGDQSFDERAVHLQKNIYGSDKGRLRLMILQRDLFDLIESRDSQQPLTILDVGCGAGLMSEWALAHGHRVTAIDSAAVMVDEVTSRLGDNPHFTAFQSTIQSLPDSEQYDVIFCHAVLEWVEEKEAIYDKIATLVKPHGTLSLMFYNAWAREMAQLVYGNFDYIDRDYQVRQRVKLNPHYPAFPDIVERELKSRDLNIIGRSGVRVFYDIMRDREHYEKHADDIIRHELRVSREYPYWQMGRYVHFMAEKASQKNKEST